jgi:bifunctional non-homologous end joining protein LigD
MSVYPMPVKPPAKDDTAELLTIGDRTVRISHPEKLYFSREVQLTKLDLVRYALAIAPGALQGIRDRPIVLKRFVNGACLESGQPEPFYQKRAPTDLPDFLRTITLSFPSGRTAEELIVDNPAGLAWIINLGCIEFHPHPVRSTDLDHPDELRIDLDPGPGVEWPEVRAVALEVKAILEENGLIGWPKTSGSRGMHVNVRIHPRWTFTEVRRAALALARAVERRVPALASSKWWKEERHGVFLDYNQNAKDRTTASAYSIRPLPDARVSAPLHWREVPDANPADFTVLTMPQLFAERGNPHEAIDAAPGSLDQLLALAASDEAEGLGDAPWPPHFAKAEGEPKRVQPSKAKSSANKEKPFDEQMQEGFGAHRFKKRSKATTTLSHSTEDQAPTASIPARGNAPGLVEENNQRAESPAHPTSVEPKDTRKTRKTPTKRTPKHPLIIVAQSTDKSAAEAGLDRWKSTHPEAAQHLAVDDILIDRMRGSSSIWYRIRVNLRHVPEETRPTQQTPDPDDDPTRAWRETSA